MTKKGTLKVSMGISRLDATRLAIEGANNPFGAATNFLANRGLVNGNFIWVDGSDGFVGNVPVIFITDAGLAATDTSAVKKSAKKTPKKKTPKKTAK